MKSINYASLVTVAAASVPNKVMLFEEFMEKYHRTYATEFEKGRRFQIFSENIDLIYSSNAKNKTYTLGLTPHTDLTFEEWRGQYLMGFRGEEASDGRDKFQAPAAFAAPESVDWVAKGGVTSVKDQGQCGSCWAFSTVGALEGAMHVSGRTMVDLSMQHIMNCDPVDNGCQGGLMDNAFEWVEKNGVTSLKDEPYLGRTTACQSCSRNTGSHCFLADCTVGNCTGLLHQCECPEGLCFVDGKCGAYKPPHLVLAAGDVSKHTDVDESENALEAAVAQQPVSVAIEADRSAFQHYTGGVLTSDACGESLDHGVLAVGYGTDNGNKYWKVKNSWGSEWGEHGYIRIEKGKAASGGECGIRKKASYPTVKPASSIVV